MAMAQAVDDFNTTLKRLIRLTSDQSLKLKLADHLLGYSKRAMLAINEAPMAPIEMIGPYLMKYQDKISKGDDAFFMAADFSDSIPAEYQADKDQIVSMIDTIKGVYRAAPAKEKADMIGLARELLKHHSAFLASQE
jgi:hypothetical protein